MRALVAVAVVVVTAAAGCGATPSDTTTTDPAAAPTGLVLSLRFDHTNVMQVALSGATATTARRFGPYVVAEKALPRDATVGLVFDASDAGTAMVCADARDVSGTVLETGCDTFNVVSAQVTHDQLWLDSVPQH
ncbi:MAG: hypothetical protein JWM53_710 [bacterium]|nr:hypothetical protein [bacterium]